MPVVTPLAASMERVKLVPSGARLADTIKGKIENAGEAVKDAAKAAGEKIKAGAEAVADKAADAAHAAGQAAKDAGQKLKEKSGA